MKWYSTRDQKREHGQSLREAVMMGLAPDGGLFVPERIPQADLSEAERRAEIARLEAQMKKAAEMLEYEYAAVLRDRLIELRGQ